MFEPVLNNFTPEIPNSVSGTPRREDAQEFLCFVMDQMHDELLKPFGQVSNTGSWFGVVESIITSTWIEMWGTLRENASRLSLLKTTPTPSLSACNASSSSLDGGIYILKLKHKQVGKVLLKEADKKKKCRYICKQFLEDVATLQPLSTVWAHVQHYHIV
ncbi:hypothetical protein MKW98_013928 [Papaver atlanticum]|uniref:Ubiquitin carboxyl-terminal hydrolase n=1 Tax=Papaver atlanticum TaxID=357466 RepID=A0AAD4SFK5_9MAGN|nr:hypothetical protein MKW98_013928 [Papaver atlanticum]